MTGLLQGYRKKKARTTNKVAATFEQWLLNKLLDLFHGCF